MRYFSTITLLILTFFFSGAVLLSAEGTLVLVSESPNAGWKVLLDREQHDFYQGVEFHLEPGVHRLEAEVSGYQRIDRPIRISDRESLTVELELIPQSALAVRPDLRETAVEYTGDIVVLGTRTGVRFVLDGELHSTPASFVMGTGDHLLTFGVLEKSISISRDTAVYVRLNPEKQQIEQFFLSRSQADELEAASGSLEELFNKGYSAYGPQWYQNFTAIFAAVCILLLGILFCVLRLSFIGRVKAAVRKDHKYKRRRKNVRFMRSPKNRKKLEKKLRRNQKQLKELSAHLNSRITLLEKRAAAYGSHRSQNTKDAVTIRKKQNACRKKAGRLKKLRQKI